MQIPNIDIIPKYLCRVSSQGLQIFQLTASLFVGFCFFNIS